MKSESLIQISSTRISASGRVCSVVVKKNSGVHCHDTSLPLMYEVKFYFTAGHLRSSVHLRTYKVIVASSLRALNSRKGEESQACLCDVRFDVKIRLNPRLVRSVPVPFSREQLIFE